MSIRVVIADDHEIMRDGLRSLIEQEADLQVVAEAENGRQALGAVRQHQPDVVIMDIAMPDLNGIDATLKIKELCPTVKIIALSMHSEQRMIDDMFRAGASAYLVKYGAFDELAHAIRAVAEGRTFISPRLEEGASLNNRIHEEFLARNGITSREREVLKLIAEGCATKQIASRLGISIKTVETHRARLLEKTGLKNAADLTRYAIHKGIVSA